MSVSLSVRISGGKDKAHLLQWVRGLSEIIYLKAGAQHRTIIGEVIIINTLIPGKSCFFEGIEAFGDFTISLELEENQFFIWDI